MYANPTNSFSAQHKIRIDQMFQTEGDETTPKYGGTLRVGYSHLWKPTTLNPLLQQGVMNYPIFGTLTRYDENGTMIPYVAKSWEFEGKNCIYYLFDNITWHDGVAFSAYDVKYSFDIVMTDPNVDISFKKDMVVLNRTEVLNSTTLMFYLNEQYAPFLTYAGRIPILPEHLYNGTDLLTNPYNENPIGVGPYKFVEWNPHINMTLAANTAYFKGRSYIDKILYRWDIPVKELPDFLMNNTIDLVPENIDPNRITELSQVPGIGITTVNEMKYAALLINFRNPDLNKINVRRALAYGINTTEIAQETYLGYAVPSKGPIPPSYSYWYNSEVTAYEFNQELAKQILDDVGYTGNPRLNLTLVVGNWDPLRLNASEVIKDRLSDIGINITIRALSNADYYQIVFVDHDFDLVLNIYPIIEPNDLYGIYHTRGGVGNPGSYSNSTLDVLLELGRNTTDATLRKSYYCDAQEIIANDIPNIFLYHQIRVSDHNNDFHGLVATPSVLSIDSYSLEKIWYDPTLSGQGKSPVKVCFIDKEGRKTGFFNGSIVNEIPNSSYDEKVNVVKIRSPPETKITVRSPNNPYKEKITIEPSYFVVEVAGTGTGHYRLELVNVALECKSVVIVEGDTYLGKIDTYYIIVYPEGEIYQTYYPPPLQITYSIGKQFIIPQDGIDPKSYEHEHSKTITPD
jgi:peptide/nickel transport system substrate-binding protein